jgi:cytochrome c-type biogenesis protein CcmH/NrfF
MPGKVKRCYDAVTCGACEGNNCAERYADVRRDLRHALDARLIFEDR